MNVVGDTIPEDTETAHAGVSPATPESLASGGGRQKAVSLPGQGQQRHDFFFRRSESSEVPQSILEGRPLGSTRTGSVAEPELMGPILRRKKVVSLPYGDSASRRAFFLQQEYVEGGATTSPKRASSSSRTRTRSQSYTRRAKANSGGMAGMVEGITRRKQVSLDLLAPERADFFQDIEEGEEEDEEVAPELDALKPPAVSEEEEAEEAQKLKKLFRPLVFSPPRLPPPSTTPTSQAGGIDQETMQAVQDQAMHASAMRRQLEDLRHRVQAVEEQEQQSQPQLQRTTSLLQRSEELMETQALLEQDVKTIEGKLAPPTLSANQERGGEDFLHHDNDTLQQQHPSPDIIRATRKDYISTAILVLIMSAMTGICLGWHTEPNKDHVIYGEVGLACRTPCFGDLESHDFFHGLNRFGRGEVLEISAYIDPVHALSGGHHYDESEGETGHSSSSTVNNGDEEEKPLLRVDIASAETGDPKETILLGPASFTTRKAFHARIDTSTFENPTEAHVINAFSTLEDDEIELTFTLHPAVLEPFSSKSVVVAACIMVAVYLLILLEVIHRTLVAVFGSMVALFIFFVMHGGHTETIAAVMLHMEWSTLGLLFGMMLIVGELSHTGIFEFASVRLLVASRGSFTRLVVLLCTLTAVASAFLDNVTTMLLVAPVTVDLCRILDVDPRPYLIGEVLLSNVGGTATLIGDPPNIIIGSSFDEIGFVDFIIYVAPCIFLLCIPVSLALVVYLYRPYFTATKMRVLDVPRLKRTYPIYDQPRLLIAGTVAFFVILMFFLHPLHHKDTAWIALVGAFITMAFTNPHDVQSALRNHIEWDTLLFFAGLFVLVEVCAAMGLLRAIGNALANLIAAQPPAQQLAIAITLIVWVSAFTSAFLDNIPYTATMIPVVKILAQELPDTLPLKTLAWALSFGACLGGNGTLLGASANIVTAGLSTNRGFDISFLNFLYPGMAVMIATVAIANLYMLVVFVWA